VPLPPPSTPMRYRIGIGRLVFAWGTDRFS
jgi:hypothetical protein